MNEQNFAQQSYLSLSAFLCLQPKNQSLDKNAPNFNTSSNMQQKTLHQSGKSSFSEENLHPSQKSSLSEEMSEQSSKGQSDHSKTKNGNFRKQKKEYSKNYRKKQKQYVLNLQRQNKDLTKKVQQLSLKIQHLTKELNNLKYGKHMNANIFDNIYQREKQQRLLQLVKNVQNEKRFSWDKFNEFADNYGFAGKQKTNLLNYYMSQIIENLLPDNLKNFILAGLSNFQIIKPYAQTIYQIENQIIGCPRSNFSSILKYLRKSMPQFVKKFHESGQNFYISFVKLTNEAKQISNHFQSIREGVFKIIPPQRYLNVIKWYEENKYSKQIQLLRKDWFESFNKK